MKKPKRSNLLLVEGQGDALVANHLADLYGVPDYYDDVPCNGIERLLRILPGHVRDSDRKCVAVVVDADTDAKARWAAVRDRLTPLEYDVPKAPKSNGVVIESPGLGRARVGIWVMPDNHSAGILEHFLQQLILPDDALLPLARSAVAALPANLRLFPEPHIPKAETYTWLAWQSTPGCSYGPAIKGGLLDYQQPAAQSYITWLRSVFDS